MSMIISVDQDRCNPIANPIVLVNEHETIYLEKNCDVNDLRSRKYQKPYGNALMCYSFATVISVLIKTYEQIQISDIFCTLDELNKFESKLDDLIFILLGGVLSLTCCFFYKKIQVEVTYNDNKIDDLIDDENKKVMMFFSLSHIKSMIMYISVGYD